MKNPCMNCEKSGCGVYHDICPDYQEYKKELSILREENIKKQQTKHDLRCIDQKHFMRKRRNRITK